MAANTQPFRRFSDPILVPVGITATVLSVPANFFTDLEFKFGKMTAFRLVNPNRCWIRLRGTTATAANPNPTAQMATPTTGWLFAPGVTEVYGTQYPVFMSCLAVRKQGIDPIPDPLDGFYPAEISYGIGA